MCSVSFLPDEGSGFILTSNRDESIDRQAAMPEKYRYHEQEIIFPKDSRVFGSWIACSPQRTVCLLNGGKEPHIPSPPYRKSRGVVLLDLLCSKNIYDFKDTYELIDIEPFTAILVENNGSELYSLIWDGEYADIIELDHTQTHFWSSSTLYDENWRSKRKKWFDDFVQIPNHRNAKDLLDFHLTGGNQYPENNLVMSRNQGKLRTVSITQITYNHTCRMFHLDLLDRNQSTLGF